MANGRDISSQQGMFDIVMDYFKELFLEPLVNRPRMEGLQFNCIDSEMVKWTKLPFSVQEIKEAFNSFKKVKVQGFDGFSIRFFLEFWDTIGEDVMKAIKDFYARGSLFRSLNPSFITLIPKKKGLLDPKVM